MGPWHGARRLVRAFAHAIRGYWTIRRRFPHLAARDQGLEVQRWARRLLDILGIGLEVHGQVPRSGPVLLVANHLSWLDIVAMHAAGHCRFVAKAQVRHWPLVGVLATGGGTLYVERESRRDAMRVVHRMAEGLQAGEIVAVFPEGTTTDGSTLLPFHGNLLQAAIATDAPVQPVAIRFVDDATGGRTAGASYVGDETLLGSLWRCLLSPAFTARLTYGEPQRAAGRTRRQWAVDLHANVLALLDGVAEPRAGAPGGNRTHI